MSARRVEFTQSVKVKRLHFAEFRCEGIVSLDGGESTTRCNAALTSKRVEFDHDIAAELGGDASFSNCRALCLLCHRAKYPEDAAKIARAKRREAAHIGASRPKGQIKSAGFHRAARTHEGRCPAVGLSQIARRMGILESEP